MKKLWNKLSLLLCLALVFTACSNQGGSAEETETSVQEETTETTASEKTEEEAEKAETEEEDLDFHLVISVDGEKLVDEDDLLYYNTTLADLIENKYDAIFDDSGFLTSLHGVEQEPDQGKYWLYYVNGEMPSVGIRDYELAEGDQVEFRLEALD